MTQCVEFKDRNFKLLVVEYLMYIQKIIQPAFDIREFCKSYEERNIDIDEEGYEVISEALTYFENINIQKEWLSEITSLCQDGGSFIWSEIIPHWDGESNDFVINSSEDVQLLPNLKKIILFYNEDNPEIINDFKDKGIDASWI